MGAVQEAGVWGGGHEGITRVQSPSGEIMSSSVLLDSAYQLDAFLSFSPAWVSFVSGTSAVNLKIQHVCSSALLICTTNRTTNIVDHTFFFPFISKFTVGREAIWHK